MKSENIESDITFINTHNNHTLHLEADIAALDNTTDKLILLVEDNDMVRETITNALHYGGYSVVSTHSGAQGLDLIRKHKNRFALVICDQCLPGISGLEVLKEIHNMSPEIQVILMSGYYMDDGHEPPLDHSFAEFLHKPCSIPHLLERVGVKMKSLLAPKL